MSKATKAQFMSGFKRETLDDVPGIEGDVIIQELSAAARTEISMRVAGTDAENPDIGEFAAQFPFIVASGMVSPKMTLKEVRRVPADKSDAFAYIATEILKLSGLWADDEEEADAADEAEPEAVGEADPNASA